MDYKKIIACMDIKNGKVVKGVRFEDVRAIEDPVALASYYNDSGADELVFYDIAASVENRRSLADVIIKAAGGVSIPFTIGGGIQTADDIDFAFSLGADKVSINTGALRDPRFIGKAAETYGSKRVTLAMDVKRSNGKFHVFTKAGVEDTGVDALYWARFCEENGAGELVVNSIDTDGVRGGFDLELLAAICERVNIPVVASGGAGCTEHFLSLFNTIPGVTAGLAASIFHLKEIEISVLKQYLRSNGVEVRM